MGICLIFVQTKPNPTHRTDLRAMRFQNVRYYRRHQATRFHSVRIPSLGWARREERPECIYRAGRATAARPCPNSYPDAVTAGHGVQTQCFERMNTHRGCGMPRVNLKAAGGSAWVLLGALVIRLDEP